MNMRGFTKIWAGALFFAAAFVLFSCNGPLEEESLQISGGNVLIRVGGAQSEARTILPQETPVFSAFDVVFTNGGGIAAESLYGYSGTDLTSEGKAFTLSGGSWTVTVSAYTASAELGGSAKAAAGSASFGVRGGGSGETVSVSVTLSPFAGTAEETGVFSWNITLPAADFATKTLTITDSTGAAIEKTVKSGAAGSAVLSPGSYTVALRLENAAGAFYGETHALQVYSGLVSVLGTAAKAYDLSGAVLVDKIRLSGTAKYTSAGSITVHTDEEATGAAIATGTVTNTVWSVDIPGPALYAGTDVYLKVTTTTFEEGHGNAPYLVLKVEKLPLSGKSGLTFIVIGDPQDIASRLAALFDIATSNATVPLSALTTENSITLDEEITGKVLNGLGVGKDDEDYSAEITWVSKNPLYVSAEGAVAQPRTRTEAAVPVTLSAIFRYTPDEGTPSDYYEAERLVTVYVTPIVTSDPSLLVHYKDFVPSADGLSILDESGSGFAGSLKSTAALSTESGSTVVTLDGSAGYVDMGAGVGAAIQEGAAFSVSTFVNIDSSEDLNANGNFLWTLSSVEAAGQSTGAYIYARPKTTSSKLGVSSAGWSPESAAEDNFPIVKSEWHHIIFTMEGNTVNCYLDGVFAFTKTVSKTLADLNQFTVAWIGRPCFSGDSYLKAKYADFRIYSKALSADEVTGLGVRGTLAELNTASGLDYTALSVEITAVETVLADSEIQEYVSFPLENPRTQKWKKSEPLTAAKEAASGKVNNCVSASELASALAAITAAKTANTGSGFGYTMVSVPAGKFQRDDTETNISVITKPYKMGHWEVTQDLYEAVMGSNPSKNKTDSNPLLPVDGGIDNTANNVTTAVHFQQAFKFCNRLSLLMGKTPVYKRGTPESPVELDIASYAASWLTDVWMDTTADGYRLPTEMEAMWAAMGANSTAGDFDGNGVNIKGYKKDFSGDSAPDTTGTDSEEYAWSTATASQPVGEKKANELGIYDLSGNLAEFCFDMTPDGKSWPTGTLTDWYNTSGSRRVVYGGCGPVNSQGARAITVSRGTENCANDWAHTNFGFRIVEQTTAE